MTVVAEPALSDSRTGVPATPKPGEGGSPAFPRSQPRKLSGLPLQDFCSSATRPLARNGQLWSPHIRVREGVGRVTACPERSRMGARRRPNANKPSPGHVRSACPDPSRPALPTLRRARSSRHRFRLFPQKSSTDCRPAAFALSREYEMIIAPWPRRKEPSLSSHSPRCT